MKARLLQVLLTLSMTLVAVVALAQAAQAQVPAHLDTGLDLARHEKQAAP